MKGYAVSQTAINAYSFYKVKKGPVMMKIKDCLEFIDEFLTLAKNDFQISDLKDLIETYSIIDV